jgi:hypothetical protein
MRSIGNKILIKFKIISLNLHKYNWFKIANLIHLRIKFSKFNKILFFIQN